MSHLPPRRYLVVVVSFFLSVLIVGAWLIFWANGYQVLLHPFRVTKTGLISLRVHPSQDVQLILNGSPIQAGQWDLTRLTPGRYRLHLEREGFQDWDRTVTVDAGEAVVLHDIVLFFQDPVARVVTDAVEQSQLTNVLADRSRFQTGIQALDGELWAEDQLLTRFSQPIDQALWLPGRSHVLVVVDSRLVVVEVDGGGLVTLAELPASDVSAQVAPLSGGQEVVVAQGEQLTVYEITAPRRFLSLPDFQTSPDQVE